MFSVTPNGGREAWGKVMTDQVEVVELEEVEVDAVGGGYGTLSPF